MVELSQRLEPYYPDEEVGEKRNPFFLPYSSYPPPFSSLSFSVHPLEGLEDVLSTSRSYTYAVVN
eukprot:m.110310 g.110310  ORF g.110310 m.110310 type:complete len:65 (-) comp9219_c0_seq12:39-233(-)